MKRSKPLAQEDSDAHTAAGAPDAVFRIPVVLRATPSALEPHVRMLVPKSKCAAVMARMMADALDWSSLTSLPQAWAALATPPATAETVVQTAHDPTDATALDREAARLVLQATAPEVVALSPLPTWGAWEPPREGERGIDLRWPADVAPKEVADWLRTHAPDGALAQRLYATVRRIPGLVWGRSDPPVSQEPEPTMWEALVNRLQLALAAHAYRAWRAIEQDRLRPAIAIDAGRTHHDLLALHKSQPKHERDIEVWQRGERYVVRLPDVATQLEFPSGNAHGEAHRAFLEAFREWKKWHGLRVWAAILWQASQAGRTGAFVWRLEEHLKAMGYVERTRRNPKVRAKVAAEVEALIKIELAVYGEDGKERARDHILQPGIRAESNKNGLWILEGMQLRISPLLYRGVRDFRSDGTPGDLGVLWYPAPVELAQVDAARNPYTLSLGFILPIRWRWDLGRHPYLALRGETLLTTAGVPIHKRDTASAFAELKRDLDELVRIGGLERYEWTDGEAWSLEASCRLYPPRWCVDRTLHGVEPIEAPQSPPTPRTGTELRAWRARHKLTQAQAAERLGVGTRTIRGAEAGDSTPLSSRLLRALSEKSEKQGTK